MGKFTDSLKRAFAGKSDLDKLKEKHGLKPDAELKPANELGHNMYVIRDSKNPRLLLHFENDSYIVRDAMVMACIWDWKTGHAFIDATKEQYPTLELVHRTEAEKHFSKEELQMPEWFNKMKK
jgi:hypothetical protein